MSLSTVTDGFHVPMTAPVPAHVVGPSNSPSAPISKEKAEKKGNPDRVEIYDPSIDWATIKNPFKKYEYQFDTKGKEKWTKPARAISMIIAHPVRKSASGQENDYSRCSATISSHTVSICRSFIDQGVQYIFSAILSGELGKKAEEKLKSDGKQTLLGHFLKQKISTIISKPKDLKDIAFGQFFQSCFFEFAAPHKLNIESFHGVLALQYSSGANQTLWVASLNRGSAILVEKSDKQKAYLLSKGVKKENEISPIAEVTKCRVDIAVRSLLVMTNDFAATPSSIVASVTSEKESESFCKNAAEHLMARELEIHGKRDGNDDRMAFILDLVGIKQTKASPPKSDRGDKKVDGSN